VIAALAGALGALDAKHVELAFNFAEDEIGSHGACGATRSLDHLVGARAVELVQIAGGATGYFAALSGRLLRWTARCRSGMLSDVLTSH
jgi:hypothetical protein